MDNNTKNFHAHGGNEWVVGGKLTFLPGAVVEGVEDLFDVPAGGGVQMPAIADSTATTVAALREDFNELLAALRTAGFMAALEAQPTSIPEAQPASTPVEETGDGT